MVHGRTENLEAPKNYPKYTLTKVSASTAVLYGYGSWILDLHKAKQIQHPSSIWTRIPYEYPTSRREHAAVIEPISQRLWILGGFEKEFFNEEDTSTSDILEMPINVSLRDLAIDCAARSISPNDPKLAPGKNIVQ